MSENEIGNEEPEVRAIEPEREISPKMKEICNRIIEELKSKWEEGKCFKIDVEGDIIASFYIEHKLEQLGLHFRSVFKRRYMYIEMLG